MKKNQCGVRNAECGTEKEKVRNPMSKIRNSDGFTYTALLAAVVIMGIALGTAGKYWSSMVLRDKEAELLFRGDQYRQAIQRYHALGGRNQYPPSIDELLKDSRTAEGKRHLRRQYKDPITGKDFVEIRDQLSRRIIGVHSSSDKEPLKQGGFPEPYREFEGANKYSDWKFQLLPTVQAPPKPLTTHRPPGSPLQQKP